MGTTHDRILAYRAALDAFVEAWDRLKTMRGELARLDQEMARDLAALVPRAGTSPMMKISEEERQETIRRYLAGEHPAAIGKDYGISSRAVWQRVRRAGIPALRRPGRRPTTTLTTAS